MTVTDADGRRISWPEGFHFDNDTICEQMRQVADSLYAFEMKAEAPYFQAVMERFPPNAKH